MRNIYVLVLMSEPVTSRSTCSSTTGRNCKSCLFRFVMQLSELQQKYKSPHFWIMLEKEFKVATSTQTCYLFPRLLHPFSPPSFPLIRLHPFITLSLSFFPPLPPTFTPFPPPLFLSFLPSLSVYSIPLPSPIPLLPPKYSL